MSSGSLGSMGSADTLDRVGEELWGCWGLERRGGGWSGAGALWGAEKSNSHHEGHGINHKNQTVIM